MLLDEIRRILKKDARLLVVEFIKDKTPLGPPVDHRIAEEVVEELCVRKGFTMVDKFYLDNNFYGIIFDY